MSQPSQTLDYQPKPPLSPTRRQGVRLLLICAAFFLLTGVNFLGCDVIFFVNPRGEGHLPALSFWHYTLFSFEQWHMILAESIQGLLVGLVAAALFLLTAWGIRRGRRWPALCGMLLAFFVSLLGVLGCAGIAAVFARVAAQSVHGEPGIIQAISVVLITGMITLFPLTGLKLLKVWREHKP
jgi:hypothetical protein